MAKRKGVNTRKRYAMKKKKIAGRVKKGFPWALVSSAVVMGCILLVRSNMVTPTKIAGIITSSSVFSVKSVTVKGNRTRTDDEVMAKCGIAAVGGIFEVNADSVRKKLAADPWIEKARCVKRFWGKVIIDIQERKPVAMVHTGEIMLIDKYGFVMPIRPDTAYELPLLCGVAVKKSNDGTVKVDSSRMLQIRVLIDSIHRHDKDFYTLIPQFDCSNERCVKGYAVAPQTTVVFDYRTGREQLTNIRYMLKTLAQRGDAPECINVQYQNLAFVTMKQKDGR